MEEDVTAFLDEVKQLLNKEDFEKSSKEFLKPIREDYNDGLSQECEGTFKIKDGKVTEINITGIALIPRFRDKNSDKNDSKRVYRNL